MLIFKDKLQLQLARPRPAGVPAVQANTAAACPAPTVTDYANAEYMKIFALAALRGFVLASAAMMAAQYNS